MRSAVCLVAITPQTFAHNLHLLFPFSQESSESTTKKHDPFTQSSCWPSFNFIQQSNLEEKRSLVLMISASSSSSCSSSMTDRHLKALYLCDNISANHQNKPLHCSFLYFLGGKLPRLLFVLITSSATMLQLNLIAQHQGFTRVCSSASNWEVSMSFSRSIDSSAVRNFSTFACCE